MPSSALVAWANASIGGETQTSTDCRLQHPHRDARFLLYAGGPARRILANEIERVVVNGNHQTRCDELDCTQRIVRPHGVVVPDGQRRQVDALLTDEAHIAKEPGVGSQIDLLALRRRQQEARGVTAVRAIRQHRAVQRWRQFEVAERELMAAADVQRVGSEALALQPGDDLGIADHEGAGALGDGNGIPEVIAVAVRDENVIGLDLLRLAAGQRVVGEIGIDQQRLAAAHDLKGGMPQPGDRRRHESLGSRRPEWLAACARVFYSISVGV
jgi:hypothetical protein